MHIFRDKIRRVWGIELTFGTAKRVLATCGVDLIGFSGVSAGENGTGAQILRVFAYSSRLGAVLACLCAGQRKERGVSEEAFGQLLLHADTLAAAEDALLDEIVTFYPPCETQIPPCTPADTRTDAPEDVQVGEKAPDVYRIALQYAAVLEVNPDGFTLRELESMYRAKGYFLWSMTASAMALFLNATRASGEPVHPDELNPFAASGKRRRTLSARDSLDLLKSFTCQPYKEEQNDEKRKDSIRYRND